MSTILYCKGLKEGIDLADVPVEEHADHLFRSVWIDLIDPVSREVKAIDQAFEIELPTREEMHEIETTSRLYHEDDARFMTASIVSKADTDTPVTMPITFVLASRTVITLRHTDPLPFRHVQNQHKRRPFGNRDAIFVALIEAIVDRQADVLENVAKDLDKLSADVFNVKDESATVKDSENRLRAALKHIGRSGDLISREQESLVSVTRLVGYAGLENYDSETRSDLYPRLKPILQDLQALTEQAAFLSNKTTFILDATLGLINLEQSGVVKIFTIAAVVFLPPTLVASIYGMNFQFMPELNEHWGYPMALGLMAISFFAPLVYFRNRGWL